MKKHLLFFAMNFAIAACFFYLSTYVYGPRMQEKVIQEREARLLAKFGPRLTQIRETFGLPAKEARSFEEFGDQLGEAFGTMLGASPRRTP